MLALYGGGLLQGRPPTTNTEYKKKNYGWVNLSHAHHGVKFDDIVVFRGKIYAIDRVGFTKLINNFVSVRKVNIGKTLSFEPVGPGNSGRFGWRKRFVVGGGVLYLVVRMEERVFKVFRMKFQGNGVFWEEVKGFGGDNNQVLFMSRYHCFFRRASKKFPGREYKDCIVFSEAAFPQYGVDCWEFTWSDGRRLGEDDIAVFRLGDGVFTRESEESSFPKIDWSPPAWMFNPFLKPEAEYQNRSVSESSGQPERESGEDDGFVSDSRDMNDGEVQSSSNDSNSKDKEEQEEAESGYNSQEGPNWVESDYNSQEDPDWVESGSESQDVVESGSDSQDQDMSESGSDQEDGKVQCDSNSQEHEDEVKHSKANIEGNASLHEEVTTEVIAHSLAVVEEVTRTLLCINNGGHAIEEETSAKNTSHSIPKSSASLATVSHNSDSKTTKFEGLDIRSDLVPTLQTIWQNHGNVIKDSIMCSGDMVAKALESLATMVRILEDNPAQSLTDSQAHYLSSTLSDLRYIRFEVNWLVSFVEKALKIHKSKSLVESLNNINQLSSQVKERRAFLLDEVAKLDVEENKLKEELAKVSKMVPFYGEVKFDEPVGVGFR